MKKSNLEIDYLSFSKKDKIAFLKKSLSEKEAKKIFLIEKNSYFQKILLSYISLDKSFLKKILIREQYHNEVRLKALKLIKGDTLFYKNIFYKKRVLINKKYYSVPYYNKIFNFCKYKILAEPTSIRFLKEL